MAPVLIPDVVLRNIGRTGCVAPLAVVLHEWDSGIEQLDSAMSYCPRPRLICPKTCHQSFHYGIGGNCTFHQYIDQDDTAWGFYSAVPTCPEPTCPEDECLSCTGLTVAQYNPDIDGNPPVLPVFVADDCETANGCVIHVALTALFPTNQNLGGSTCCDLALPGYVCAVQSLAFIFTEAGLTPSTTTLLIHCNEHNCIDIDQLVEDIIAYQNLPAPVLPTCSCIAAEVTPVLRAGFMESGSYTGATIDLTQALAIADGPTFIFTSVGGTGTTIALGSFAGVGPKHIWIKNSTNSILDITPSTTIDGSANPIHLDPVSAGAFPFGNDGGEAVHLVWSDTSGGWYVL